MTDEQKEHVRLWVAALRSGEFEQVTNSLREENAYCCLGVACEVYRREAKNGEWAALGEFYANADSSSTSMPFAVAEWFGVRGSPYSSAGISFADMNDVERENFATIADAIEKTYLEVAA